MEFERFLISFTVVISEWDTYISRKEKFLYVMKFLSLKHSIINYSYSSFRKVAGSTPDEVNDFYQVT
jgi:hypothetical protein